MSNTTPDERQLIARLAAEAVNRAKADHNRWHWDTKQTACPWGCGDGSGIVGK
jgi:hypothetical protein